MSASCQMVTPIPCIYSGAIHALVRDVGLLSGGSSGTISLLTSVKDDTSFLLPNNSRLPFVSTIVTTSDETDTDDNAMSDYTRVTS